MSKANSRVAIFSDLHLGVHMNRSQWHNIALDWAKWYTDQLLEKDIKNVIFCGDFFHSRSEITVDTLYKASELLNLFNDFNVIMITGNHDSFYKHNSSINSIKILDNRKNVRVIDTPTQMTLHGKEIFLAPWGTTVSDIPTCDVLFGHFEIESFKMNTYKICEEGFKSSDLLKFAPLVVSGHFHLREERKYDNGTILYVGSPFELDFGDAQSVKGYYILDLADNSYEFFPNELSPKHQKISLSTLVKMADFNEKAPQIFANNIIKLVLDKKIDSKDLEKLSTKFSSYSPLSLEIDQSFNFTLFSSASQEEVDLSGIDIPKAISDFVDMLDIQNKKDVIEYTVSLYSTCK
jgi:DNA repair exonuclease SbcCD nuclease subunit